MQLFLGDTNRVVAETPLNQASSRSHCVFTLHIEARRAGEAVVRRSKLHFVDLAGSERVGKTGLAAHAQLKEAKYINLSLHFLEQVWRKCTRLPGSGRGTRRVHVSRWAYAWALDWTAASRCGCQWRAGNVSWWACVRVEEPRIAVQLLGHAPNLQ